MARLTSPSSTPARAGKREAGRKGARLARIRPQGRRGQAARRRRAHPLGSAHAGDGAGTSLLRHGCSLGVSLRWEEESSEAKRESVRVKNEARVEGGAVGRGVLMPRAARSTVDLRSTARRARASFGPGGRCCSAKIPAQAQVAAWARGSALIAAAAVGRGPVALLWAGSIAAGSGRNGQTNSTVTVFFYFPENNLMNLN